MIKYHVHDDKHMLVKIEQRIKANERICGAHRTLYSRLYVKVRALN